MIRIPISTNHDRFMKNQSSNEWMQQIINLTSFSWNDETITDDKREAKNNNTAEWMSMWLAKHYCPSFMMHLDAVYKLHKATSSIYVIFVQR